MGESTRYQSWMRLFKILEELRKGGGVASEIAEKLGVSESAMRRDLRWLSVNREEVRWRREGRGKRYFTEGKGEVFFYPAAFALLLGSQATASLAESGVFDGIRELLERARELLGSNAERKIVGLSPHFKLDEYQQDRFDLLVQAIREQRVILISYASPKMQVYTETVKPVSLVLERSRLYLVVMERVENKFGLRRLDRIQEVQWAIPKKVFDYPSKESYDPARLFHYSFGPFMHTCPPETPIFLRFYGEEASFHREYDWPVPFRVVQNEPFEVELEAYADYSFFHFVMRLGAGVEVLAPEVVRLEVASFLACAHERYQIKYKPTEEYNEAK